MSLAEPIWQPPGPELLPAPVAMPSAEALQFAWQQVPVREQPSARPQTMCRLPGDRDTLPASSLEW